MKKKWWEMVKNILSNLIKPVLLLDLRRVKQWAYQIKVLEEGNLWKLHLTKDAQELVVVLELIFQ